MVFSIMGIVVLGLVVWAHHMFTSGTPPWMRLFFTIATAFIAVPTGIKFFNWVATLWGGKISINSAMLFSCGFIINFVFGGITGVDKTTNRLVPSIAQQYIGNCISFNPGLLNLIMVAIKFIPPNIELPPSNRTLRIQIICPD